MSVLLPSLPGIRTAEPQLLDFGAVQQGALGGAAQRLNRLGNRFALAVELPPALSATHGRVYVARLLKALTDGAIYPFPQPGLAIGAPGTPLVNGAGQSGSALVLDGFTAGYAVREGQFFSIIHGGRRYLHQASADTTANGSGQLTLAITPMLRISPADNAVCEFAVPYIEGFVSGDSAKWHLKLTPYHEIAFSITEAR
jgi:hypothetical protein